MIIDEMVQDMFELKLEEMICHLIEGLFYLQAVVEIIHILCNRFIKKLLGVKRIHNRALT
jgi:hypothetical protein